MVKPDTLNECMMKWASQFTPEDCRGCAELSAEAIIAGKAEYLLDVKANQRNLEEEIAEYVKDDELRGSMDKKRTVEKNRERIEIRTAYTSDDAAWLCGREKWKNLCCIGAIRKEVEADGKRTEEWHHYISSRKLSAEELLHHARMEWAVESMHWLLDVHYGEDYCRIANKAAQQNLNSLCKFALSLIKRYKAQTNSKRPLSQIMLDCLLELDLLCAVLEN